MTVCCPPHTDRNKLQSWEKGQWLVLVLLCIAVTTRVVFKVVYDALVTRFFFCFVFVNFFFYIFVESFEVCGCAGREKRISAFTLFRAALYEITSIPEHV